MLCFPNAKINLGLNITEKRSDGYHNLLTVFYPIPLNDVLEITKSDGGQKNERLFTYGIPVEGTVEENLTVRAYRLLRDEFSLPPVDIYLYKNIPSGAGLGGGSSDAAFTLMMLNELFSLELTPAALEERASRLGADCPFFIVNRPVSAAGIGNLLTPIEFSLSGLILVIVKPPLHVSTKEAYSGVTPHAACCPPAEALGQAIEEWNRLLVNDFEETVFIRYPEIGAIKKQLTDEGAIYAAMSGSGSALFGLFKQVSPNLKKKFSGYFYYETIL